jgi:hypothetical protein
MLDLGKALGHHTAVLRAHVRYELAAMRWHRVSP